MDLFGKYQSKEYVLLAHVFIEFSHLRKLVSEFPWTSQDDWIYRALLEATLIKARSIGEFFLESNNRKTDVKASHFLNDWQVDSELFQELNELVNKQVAHITDQRFISGDESMAETGNNVLRLLSLVIAEIDRFEDAFKIHHFEYWQDLRRETNLY
jgi:hypothetical protein